MFYIYRREYRFTIIILRNASRCITFAYLPNLDWMGSVFPLILPHICLFLHICDTFVSFFFSFCIFATHLSFFLHICDTFVFFCIFAKLYSTANLIGLDQPVPGVSTNFCMILSHICVFLHICDRQALLQFQLDWIRSVGPMGFPQHRPLL